MFNPETNPSKISRMLWHRKLRGLGLEARNVPSVLEDFIDTRVGSNRQLTLRLAS